MDAGPVLQENVFTTLRGRRNQLECNQLDGSVGGEDDLQVEIANQHSGSSRLDQVSPAIACDK